MRHRVKGRKLNRTASHRSATMRALATALIREKKIKTTLAKAKEIRTFVEPMITRAKNDSVAARRIIAKDIKDKEVLKELFNEIVPKVGDRPGGYTRVVKLGRRLGDAAEMAIIELVDYNDLVERKKPRKAKTEDAKVVEETVVDEAVNEETKAVDEKEAENTEVVEATVEEEKAEVSEEASVAEETTDEVKEEESSEEKAEKSDESKKKDDSVKEKKEDK
ncbi:MAG: 50S ribosomal protein L17 [Bacteroidota bacterium]